MQSLTQQLHAGLMQPEMTQLLLPPYETTAPYDSRVSYDPSVSYDTTVPYTTTVPYDTTVPYTTTVPYDTTVPYNTTVPYDASVAYNTTVPYTTYDSRATYDTRAWDRQGAYLQDWVAVSMPAGTNDQKVPDPTPQETKQPQEWKAVENEPEEPQGTLEWPRPPQQTTLLLIVCGLFLFLVLTGMPAAFYI
uniref:Uncharacterized protein n=1 Tax=Pipistrellus kuhlii TaxID=59472 RepID=A0A7J7QWZ6_PIPKU|nr:hypothetical protein mPipKuh1_008227 [Pipistrellus kuhlii]